MSSVDVNDPTIKKVNFRKNPDISLLFEAMGALAAGQGHVTQSADSYFETWEQRFKTTAGVTVSIEELNNIKLSSWNHKMDIYAIISLGPMSQKSQTSKRTERDVKLKDAVFDFRLPADWTNRSWELVIELFDDSISGSLGGVYIDMNDIFAADEVEGKAPLKLEYKSILLNLVNPKYGEDCSGQIRLSIKSSVAFPKRPPFRDRKSGLLDLEWKDEELVTYLTDREAKYFTDIKIIAQTMEDIYQKVVKVTGRSCLKALLDSAYPAPPYLFGMVASSSIPKLKALSMFKLGSSPTLRKSLVTTTMSDFPPDVIANILVMLPPHHAYSLRRVAYSWSIALTPSMLPFWDCFRMSKSITNLPTSADKTPLLAQFVRLALPIYQSWAHIVQLLGNIRMHIQPICIPTRDKNTPLTLGPLQPLLDLVGAFAKVDMLRLAIMSCIPHSDSWKTMTQLFQGNWESKLNQEEMEMAGVLFGDLPIWKDLYTLFTNPNLLFEQALTTNLSAIDLANLSWYTEIIVTAIVKKRITNENELKRCCNYLAELLFLFKSCAPTLRSKEKSYLQILADHERWVDQDLIRALIAGKIMKDRSFTPCSQSKS